MTPLHSSGGRTEAPLSRRTAVWVSVAAAVSFITALLLMAFEPDPVENGLGIPTTFSSSALGHRALRQFLEESGLPGQVRRSRAAFRGSRDTPLLAIEPRVGGRDGEEEAGIRYLGELTASPLRVSAPVVLVLPKWEGIPLPTRQGWVQQVTLLARSAVEEALVCAAPGQGPAVGLKRVLSFSPRILPCRTAWGEELAAELIAPQLLEMAAPLQPVVWTEEGILVGRMQRDEEGTPPLYLVSDPDLLNNHGLPRGDNAALVLGLLEKEIQARRVVFDEVIHGLERDMPFLAETLRFPLVLNVLNGSLLFALVLWRGMSRFGKPLPAPPRLEAGKAGLIENTAQLLTRRGRIQESAARYFEEVLEDVARHYHLARERSSPEESVEVLQRISERRGGEGGPPLPAPGTACCAGIRQLTACQGGRGRAGPPRLAEGDARWKLKPPASRRPSWRGCAASSWARTRWCTSSSSPSSPKATCSWKGCPGRGRPSWCAPSPPACPSTSRGSSSPRT